MRSAAVSDWLTQSDWAGWHRVAMTGDASARRYERLIHPAGAHVILMDAPPATCGSQCKFVQIAKHLLGLGLCAPKVFAWQKELGLLVLEDLGQMDFARHLTSHPQDERPLYEAAVDVLLHLGTSTPPIDLNIMTPAVGAQMIDIAFDWAATDKSEQLSNEIKGGMVEMLTAVSPRPSTLSLRDFHAENLIWRSDKVDHARVGLLDFQDAFITHPAYDLASLLRDARRDVDPGLTAPLLTRMGGGEDLRAAFHIHAVQRNLRILGIFNRLARRDQKAGYISLIPRVRNHLLTDLAAPELRQIAPLIRRAFDLIESTGQ